MKIFNRPTLTLDERRDVEAHPELWTPPHLVDPLRSRGDEIGASVTPFAHTDWVAQLRGDFLVIPAEGPKRLRAGLLGEHLRNAFLAGEYANAEWTSETRDEFFDRLDTTIGEVTSDGDQAWAAYHHITTIRLLAEHLERESRQRQEEEARDRAHRCPVCNQMNSHLKHRRLEMDPHGFGMFEHAASIFSCRPCWMEAVQQNHTRRALEACDDAGTTRAEIISAWLAAQTAEKVS